MKIPENLGVGDRIYHKRTGRNGDTTESALKVTYIEKEPESLTYGIRGIALLNDDNGKMLIPCNGVCYTDTEYDKVEVYRKKDYLTPGEARAILQVRSPSVLSNYERKGQLHPVRISFDGYIGNRMYLREEIEKLAADRESEHNWKKIDKLDPLFGRPMLKCTICKREVLS